MAGMEDFIGGRSAWGAPEYGLYPLANAMVRADTPVVAQVPAQPQGYYANNAPMPGAMQAWQDMGIAPVMYHPNSPYATAAYRVVPDPFGQMAVQPLTGFPSVYPHVLPGVAPNPFQTMFPMLQAMMPPTMPLQWGGAQQPKRASGGGGGNTSGNRSIGTQPKQPVRPVPKYFLNDEMQNVIPPDPSMFAAAPVQQPAPTGVGAYSPAVQQAMAQRWGVRPPTIPTAPEPVVEPAPSYIDMSRYMPAMPMGPLPYDDGPFVNGIDPYKQSTSYELVGPPTPTYNPKLHQQVETYVRSGDYRSPLQRMVDNYVGEQRGQLSLPVNRPLAAPQPAAIPAPAPSALQVPPLAVAPQEPLAIAGSPIGEPGYDYMADYSFAPEPVYDLENGVFLYPGRIRDLTYAR